MKGEICQIDIRNICRLRKIIPFLKTVILFSFGINSNITYSTECMESDILKM